MKNGVTLSENTDGKKRLLHIEAMRIIAIFLVMFNHTGTNGFFRFAQMEPSLKQWICLFLSISCKVAVPLFFMISGALLLGKKETLGEILKKRVLKYGLILIVISLIYWGYDVFARGKEYGFGYFMIMFYAYWVSAALWYLYEYLALMLMLPFLRKLAQAMDHTEYLYMALMSLLFVGVIPIVDFLVFRGEHVLNRHIQGTLFVTTSIVYFMMGYYIEHVMSKKYQNKKMVIAGAAASIISIIICSAMTLYRIKITGIADENESQWFFECLIAIPTYTIYLSAKMFFEKVQISEWIEKTIVAVGGTVFGIYLLERMLRNYTKAIFTVLTPYIGAMPACFIWLFCAMIIGAAVVLMLKKIPVIRKVL